MKEVAKVMMLNKVFAVVQSDLHLRRECYLCQCERNIYVGQPVDGVDEAQQTRCEGPIVRSVSICNTDITVPGTGQADVRAKCR